MLVAIALLAGGCGRDKPEVAAGQTLSDEAVKQKCADQQWREQNLGVWYAVCRQPVGVVGAVQRHQNCLKHSLPGAACL